VTIFVVDGKDTTQRSLLDNSINGVDLSTTAVQLSDSQVIINFILTNTKATVASIALTTYANLSIASPGLRWT
jgi:hypothetical protein